MAAERVTVCYKRKKEGLRLSKREREWVRLI